MKNKWTALAGAALAASLVVAPIITTGAAAADTVGVVGVLEDATNVENGTGYWQTRFAAHKATCYSHEGSGGSDHGTITNGGLTVTLKPYGASWPGDHWEVLVVKAGNTNNVIVHPDAGVAYASPDNNGGQQAQVSHWIVCKGTTPTPPPATPVTPALTFSLPTCLADGVLTRSENVDWTELKKDDGSSVWTAVPRSGQVLSNLILRDWPVPNLTKLSADHELCKVPAPLVVNKEWKDGVWACGETTVTQTREVVTTVYQRNDEGVLTSTSSTATQTQERDLTQAEIATCPLETLPGAIRSVCVSDVPHLGYAVTLPAGYTPTSENPVTITFVNPDGEDYVVEGQPLAGTLLWPGASDAEPKMWPGWALVDGEYVETDGNFAWTRKGITVHFAVNPTYETTVEYPEATALCASPPAGDPETPVDDPAPTAVTPATPATPAAAAALAVTGGGVNPMVPLAGGLVLLAGIGTLAFVTHRRRASAE